MKLLALFCMFVLAPTFKATQAQGVVNLPPSNGSIGEGFTNISSVRELPDGRVLIVDPRERRVAVGEWSRGLTRDLGRTGAGPGEYRSPRQLLALGPDSTLLLDTQQRRLIIIVRADSLRSFPVEAGVRITRFEYPLRGLSRDGRLIAYSAIPNPYPGVVPSALQLPFGSESLLVVTVRLRRAGVDTIARIAGRFRGRRTVERTIEGRQWEFGLVNPLGVEEQAWMFPDGWMALVLASPYRVDWLTPGGRWVRGAPLPHKLSATSHAEKVAAIERYGTNIPGPPLDPSEYPGWPEFIPPFPNNALLPLADGRLAVERTVTRSATAQLYDIVDRTGTLTGRIAVPLDARIIAFGRESVYLVTRGELDLERLTRHPLPTF